MASNPIGNLDAALAYAGRGWQVFPCHFIDGGGCSCGGHDKCSPGKHPMTPNGLKDASSDPEQIRAWWSQWPRANVAIRTGPESGVWVLDLDGSEGIAAFAELEAANGPVPATPAAATGGGGRHLFFALPTGCEIRNR